MLLEKKKKSPSIQTHHPRSTSLLTPPTRVPSRLRPSHPMGIPMHVITCLCGSPSPGWEALVVAVYCRVPGRSSRNVYGLEPNWSNIRHAEAQSVAFSSSLHCPSCHLALRKFKLDRQVPDWEKVIPTLRDKGHHQREKQKQRRTLRHIQNEAERKEKEKK